jgi:hypothetical protein
VIFLPQPAHSCGEVFFCVSAFTSIVILAPVTKPHLLQDRHEKQFLEQLTVVQPVNNVATVMGPKVPPFSKYVV